MVNIKKFPRGILDQVISGVVFSSRAAGTRAPDPGLKRQAIEESVPYTDVIEAQASSNKQQASSVKLSNQPVQSPSGKHPNQSNKRQASSRK